MLEDYEGEGPLGEEIVYKYKHTPVSYIIDNGTYTDIKSSKDEIYRHHYPDKLDKPVPSTPADITDFMRYIWVDD